MAEIASQDGKGVGSERRNPQGGAKRERVARPGRGADGGAARAPTKPTAEGGAKAADLENVSNGLLRIFHLRALGLGDRWDSAITPTLDRLRLPVRAAA